MKSGIELIAEERQEQLEKHGWNLMHDVLHTDGALAKVAATLAANGTDLRTICAGSAYGTNDNPWGLVDKLQNDRIHQLRVAGALIAAEIDRLQA